MSTSFNQGSNCLYSLFGCLKRGYFMVTSKDVNMVEEVYPTSYPSVNLATVRSWMNRCNIIFPASTFWHWRWRRVNSEQSGKIRQPRLQGPRERVWESVSWLWFLVKYSFCMSVAKRHCLKRKVAELKLFEKASDFMKYRWRYFGFHWTRQMTKIQNTPLYFSMRVCSGLTTLSVFFVFCFCCCCFLVFFFSLG